MNYGLVVLHNNFAQKIFFLLLMEHMRLCKTAGSLTVFIAKMTFLFQK